MPIRRQGLLVQISSRSDPIVWLTAKRLFIRITCSIGHAIVRKQDNLIECPMHRIGLEFRRGAWVCFLLPVLKYLAPVGTH